MNRYAVIKRELAKGELITTIKSFDEIPEAVECAIKLSFGPGTVTIRNNATGKIVKGWW